MEAWLYSLVSVVMISGARSSRNERVRSFLNTNNWTFDKFLQANFFVYYFLRICNPQVFYKHFIHQKFPGCIGRLEVPACYKWQFIGWQILIIREFGDGIEICFFFCMIKFECGPLIIVVFNGGI